MVARENKTSRKKNAKRTPVKRTPRKKSMGRKRKKKEFELSDSARRFCFFLVFLLFIFLFYRFCIKPYSYRWKPCPGERVYKVCMPCKYGIHGVDISHHQGAVNWKRLQECQEGKYPIHFMFIKATEGGDHKDDAFDMNFENARKFGFIRGVYHYFIPRTDARKQAEFFINTVQLETGDLPPVLDVEESRGKSSSELQKGVKEWLDVVEKHYGVKPILYTSYKFKLKYLDNKEFDRYPYWIAHYYVDSVKYEKKWHFWQHTDIGRVPGINHDVDLNVFNGSLEELKMMTIQKPVGVAREPESEAVLNKNRKLPRH